MAQGRVVCKGPVSFLGGSRPAGTIGGLKHEGRGMMLMGPGARGFTPSSPVKGQDPAIISAFVANYCCLLVYIWCSKARNMGAGRICSGPDFDFGACPRP